MQKQENDKNTNKVLTEKKILSVPSSKVPSMQKQQSWSQHLSCAESQVWLEPILPSWIARNSLFLLFGKEQHSVACSAGPLGGSFLSTCKVRSCLPAPPRTGLSPTCPQLSSTCAHLFLFVEINDQSMKL